MLNGLQSIPGDSNDKDVAAMLDQGTTEANEDSFVQHGGNDVTWNRSWCALHFRLVFAFYILQNYHFRLQCSF